MFKKSLWVAVFSLFSVTGAAQAVPTYLNFTGQIIGNPETNNSNKTLYGEFIQGMTTGSSYDFTFVYDSNTITPDATNTSSNLDTAVYTTQLSLVSGQVGSYSDFSGWSLTFAVFGTGKTHRGGQDYFEIRLNSGINTIFLNVNYGDDGDGYVGEDAWDNPFPFPTTEELNTPSLASTALFDSRYYNSGLGRLIYYEYNGGDGFGATATPEPATAVVMVAAMGVMLGRRRRSA
ncbi:PEP-CTERM sorting domain-containing protein [Planctomycetales bacterium ZRK34]|nr:PEP-CTERM sorting domain-containing protein [Planctomycetales bacterium ZRK34]